MMPGRRIVDRALAGALAAWLLGAAAPKPSAQDLPRLTGIVVSDERSAAIFEDGSGAITILGEGETLQSMTVQSIGPQGVRLVGPSRTLMLRPTASGTPAGPVDTGGVTFGLVVNEQGPPDD